MGDGFRLLVTGGSGFVGANLAVELAQRRADWSIVAVDNLKRRGSELNLPRLAAAGVTFEHADVRQLDDLMALGKIDALVECSAEPSVLAGVDGAVTYPLQTNLVGAFHCLELARRDRAQFVFLSTSRVYSVPALRSVRCVERETRFELAAEQQLEGVGAGGISEDFVAHPGERTLYGATKLAGELLIEEYRAAFGVRAVVDRCGVIAGPWQMGKVDQGVFGYWLLAHYFGHDLTYIGYGGSGKQVRDLVHVADLADLIEDQLTHPDAWDGVTANVGGGRACSLSLVETTELCQGLTGRRVRIGREPETRPGDVPIYISDTSLLSGLTAWRPRRGPEDILSDMFAWISENERDVKAALRL